MMEKSPEFVALENKVREILRDSCSRYVSDAVSRAESTDSLATHLMGVLKKLEKAGTILAGDHVHVTTFASLAPGFQEEIRRAHEKAKMEIWGCMVGDPYADAAAAALRKKYPSYCRWLYETKWTASEEDLKKAVDACTYDNGVDWTEYWDMIPTLPSAYEYYDGDEDFEAVALVGCYVVLNHPLNFIRITAVIGEEKT